VFLRNLRYYFIGTVYWIQKWVQSLIFPVYCLGCGKEGDFVCIKCDVVCPKISLQRCTFCLSVSLDGATCAECVNNRFLDGVIVRGSYKIWLWRKLIHSWKYRHSRALDEKLSKYIIDCLFLLPLEVSNFIVVPVPLTKKREKRRGFNQAKVLADALAKQLNLKCLPLIERTKETSPQAGLSAIARRHNVRDAFRCRDEKLIIGRQCIIVDDIVTTGATFEEVARVLKKAGALTVWGLALVRSELN